MSCYTHKAKLDAGVYKTLAHITKRAVSDPNHLRGFYQKLRHSSLRCRTETGRAITNIHLKTNWSNWSTDASMESSPLDTPESSTHNTPYHVDSSPLSSPDDKDQNNIPFPKLNVPELDFQLPLP
jgi:hypothetical protein